MTTRTIGCLAAALLAGAIEARADEAIPPAALRTAAEKGLDLLVKTSPTFVKKGGCNSCHNQTLPAAVQAFARARGIDAGAPIEQLPPELSETTTERYAEYAAAGGSGVNALAFEMFAYALGRTPADTRIRAQVQYIKSQQMPEGYWRGRGGLTNNGQQALSRPAATRPPLVFDDFTPTAYMIRALKTYGAPAEAADTKARIEKARRWLQNTTAARLQEHAFQVLGLVWASADRAAIAAAARGLRNLQQPDGGFSQLPTLPSDAYATGIALFALHESGMRANDAVYQAGLKFLLDTQAADGTWHVRSRSLEFQPYFESGYPYGRDQWISAAGTAYATLAIAAAVDPPASNARR
jgi:N-acyl-D-amino-acid deacylase